MAHTVLETKICFSTFRGLLVSYSASVRYREENGEFAADNLIDKTIENIKKILGKSADLNLINIDVSNEFYMVLSRKPCV